MAKNKAGRLISQVKRLSGTKHKAAIRHSMTVKSSASVLETKPLANGRFLVRSTAPSKLRSAKSFTTQPALRIRNVPAVKAIKISASGTPLDAIHNAQ